MNSSRDGIIYIAFGPQFQAEARQAMESVRRQDRAIPVAVITDEPWAMEPKPDLFIERPRDLTYGAKPRLLWEATPFERTLFLDTDTTVVRTIRPLFDLLDHYDFGLRFAGPEVAHEPGLLYHPYAHSAALLYQRNEAAREIFGLWADAYARALKESEGAGQRCPSADRLLAGAVARSRARVVALPSHVLSNLVEPEVLYAPPIICHGRIPDVEEYASRLIDTWKRRRPHEPLQRVWLPNIRGLLPSGLRRSDPFLAISLCIQRVINGWRRRGEKK